MCLPRGKIAEAFVKWSLSYSEHGTLDEKTANKLAKDIDERFEIRMSLEVVKDKVFCGIYRFTNTDDVSFIRETATMGTEMFGSCITDSFQHPNGKCRLLILAFADESLYKELSESALLPMHFSKG